MRSTYFLAPKPSVREKASQSNNVIYEVGAVVVVVMVLWEEIMD